MEENGDCTLDNGVEMWYNIVMNGYDFDNTILHGNSTRRFAFFCAARFPYLVLLVPFVLFVFLLRALRIINMNRYLHMLEWFLVFVPNVDKLVIKFWDKNMKHIKSWYLEQKRDDDVVISASPYFLVSEACRRLGVNCIATDVDTRARLHSPHVFGEVKVTAYKNVYGDQPLASYYSDSMTDVPIFKLAEKGYFVKGNEVSLLYDNGEPVA